MKESETAWGWACAACKFQRRGCPPDCIFRPYFPPEKSTEFKNAHDLFGTNKIRKILQKAQHPGLRDDAAKAIIFESYIRKKFPVHGCSQVISALVNKIEQVNAELQGIRAETAQIKSALAAASQFPTPPPPPLNHNYFPRDFFTGGGDPESQLPPPPLNESANRNYGYATEFLAAEQALDSLCGETSTHGQEQLPDLNDLVPLPENTNRNYGYATEFLAAEQALDSLSGGGNSDSNDLAPLPENTNRNYGYATEFIAAQQALSLGVPYPPNNDGHNQSATNDLYSDGGRYGSFAYGEPTMYQPQQVLPDDDNDIFSFDFPIHTNDDEFIPTKETGDQMAKYMPKDDGNPFS